MRESSSRRPGRKTPSTSSAARRARATGSGRLVAGLALVAAAACGVAQERPHGPVWSESQLVGRYAQAGPLGYLELREDGAFECFVVNGVTADGCGTFEGAGICAGRWRLEEGAVRFAPTPPRSDLVVDMAQVRGTPTAEGLRLELPGGPTLLAARSEVN